MHITRDQHEGSSYFLHSDNFVHFATVLHDCCFQCNSPSGFGFFQFQFWCDDFSCFLFSETLLIFITMTYQDLPSRQKSQRLLNRIKTQKLQQYKQWAMDVSNINELLPGLNDISDAFEALPMDLTKYFTLLKEIDAKCINTVPQINFLIKKYVDSLHENNEEELEQKGKENEKGENNKEAVDKKGEEKGVNDKVDENTDEKTTEKLAEKTDKQPNDEKADQKEEKQPNDEKNEKEKVDENGTKENGENNEKSNLVAKVDQANQEVSAPVPRPPISELPTQREREIRRLTILKHKINEIIPCLEEKMHVTSVATDLVNKHMFRINNDYKLILNNNEIPELIRIGPLNHPAMIVDLSLSSNGNSLAVDRSANLQRSESRREALAAKKANKDDDDVTGGDSPHPGAPGKKRKNKEGTPLDPRGFNSGANSDIGAGSPVNGVGKKRSRKEATEEPQGPSGPGSGNNSDSNMKKKRLRKEEQGKSGFKLEARVSVGDGPRDSGNEPTYCYCDQVSFGEMVGCDGDDCKREWFHLPCIGYKNPPKGTWYCDDCLMKMRRGRR